MKSTVSPLFFVILAVLGPVAAGLLLDYIRERRALREPGSTEPT